MDKFKAKNLYINNLELVFILLSLALIIYLGLNIPVFRPEYNIVFELVIIPFTLLTAYKSYSINKIDKDKRLVIISISFLFGSIFRLLHLVTSFQSSIQFIYSYISVYYFLSGIILSLIYCPYSKTFDEKVFKKNTFRSYLIMSLVLLTCIVVFTPDKIASYILYMPLENIYLALLLISTAIYQDIRKRQGYSRFSNLELGFILLILSELVIPTRIFFESTQRFVLHIFTIWGFYFIYKGVEGFILKQDYFSVKHKFLLFNSIFICFLYLLSVIVSLATFGQPFYMYFKYLFFIVFAVLLVIGYSLTGKITKPINNVMEGIDKNNPGYQPVEIKVISYDEIGKLTQKFNENNFLMYKYNNELKKYADNEGAIIRIIEIARKTLDIDTVFHDICKEVRNIFNADRVSLAYHPDKTDYKRFSIRSEYKKTPLIKGIEDLKDKDLISEFYAQELYKTNGYLKYDNIQNAHAPDFFKSAYLEIGVKSLLSVPVRSENDNVGFFAISIYDDYREWSNDDIKLSKAIASQIYIANKQSELYTETKKQAERSELIRKITDSVRSSLDPEKIKNEIVRNIGLTLEAERVFFTELDEKTNKFYPIKNEFRLNEDIKSMKEVILDVEVPEVVEFMKYPQMVITRDMDQNLDKFALRGTKFESHVREYNIKSGIVIPIFCDNKFYGILVLHFSKTQDTFTDDKIEFIKILTDQVSLALSQAKLFESAQKSAEREYLTRYLVEAIRSSLDLKEVKQTIVNAIGKIFKSDRCYFRPVDKETKLFLRPEVEYLSSDKVRSLKNIEPNQAGLKYFFERAMEEKGLSPILVTEELIQQQHLESTPLGIYFKDSDIKADYAIPIWTRNEDLIYLVIHYMDEMVLSHEEKEILTILSKQIQIAIDQSKLYEELQLKAKREKTIREIIEAIRSTLDLEQILGTICEVVSKEFNVQRATVTVFPDFKDFKNYKILKEYKSDKSIKGVSEYDDLTDITEFWGNAGIRDGKIVAISNMETVDVPDKIRKFFNHIGVKSIISVPIKKGNDVWGIFSLSSIDHFTTWSDDEKSLFSTIGDQLFIAIKQAQLYQETKETAEEESFTRKIIEIANSDVHINEKKRFIVTEVGKFFKADRCIYFNAKVDEFSLETVLPSSEYRVSHDIKSYVGYVFDDDVIKSLLEDLYSSEYGFVYDFETYLQEGTLESKRVYEYSQEREMFSAAAVTFEFLDKYLGALVIEFVNEKVLISQKQLIFLKEIANHIGAALNQDLLYQTAKLNAERERSLRMIVEQTRSSLDINKIKQTCVCESGEILGASRVFISEYDEQLGLFYTPDEFSEYRVSTDIKSVRDFGDNFKELKLWVEKVINKEEINFFDIEEFIANNNLEGTVEEEFLLTYNIKASMLVPIFYADNLLGGFVINYDKKVSYSEEDLEFVRSIANQTAIAMYQAMLYKESNQTAYKESILREIVSEIKVTDSIEEIYKYIINKILDIFNVHRVAFFETPAFKFEQTYIKYETLKDDNCEKLMNSKINNVFLESISNKGEKPELMVVNNSFNQFQNDTQVIEFIEKFRLNSFISIPFIRYNADVKILGILVISDFRIREWTEFEIELVESIANTVVSVIADISKISEINRLRDFFVVTLAHDIWVPLVGERKVLDFLAKRPEDELIGQYATIFEELINNNEELSFQLKQLIDIYNYESGKKELDLSSCDLVDIINSVISEYRGKILAKEINLIFDYDKTLPMLMLDKEEIAKVFLIIIDNAVKYTPQNQSIAISTNIENNTVVICISDTGPGIPEDIRENIFERFAMAKTFERKVGKGFSLYLCKQIVNAHKGDILLTTEIGKGSNFCVVLPFDKF